MSSTSTFTLYLNRTDGCWEDLQARLWWGGVARAEKAIQKCIKWDCGPIKCRSDGKWWQTLPPTCGAKDALSHLIMSVAADAAEQPLSFHICKRQTAAARPSRETPVKSSLLAYIVTGVITGLCLCRDQRQTCKRKILFFTWVLNKSSCGKYKCHWYSST